MLKRRLFRFGRENMHRTVYGIGWSSALSATNRSRYECTHILIACVILPHLCSSLHWKHMELLLGGHGSLWEMICEAIEQFVVTLVHLSTWNLSSAFLARTATIYGNSIQDTRRALNTFIAFIRRAAIAISVPVQIGSTERFVQKETKRNTLWHIKRLKRRMVSYYMPIAKWVVEDTTGLSLWKAVRKQSSKDLPVISGRQYVIMGISGIVLNLLRELYYEDVISNSAQHAFNKATSRTQVTVEWGFKEIKLCCCTVDCRRKMRID